MISEYQVSTSLKDALLSIGMSAKYWENRMSANLVQLRDERRCVALLQSKYLPTDIRQSWLEYVRYLYRSSPPIRDCYFCMRKEGVYTERMDRFLFGAQAEAFGTALAVNKADFPQQQDAIV